MIDPQVAAGTQTLPPASADIPVSAPTATTGEQGATPAVKVVSAKTPAVKRAASKPPATTQKVTPARRAPKPVTQGVAKTVTKPVTKAVAPKPETATRRISKPVVQAKPAPAPVAAKNPVKRVEAKTAVTKKVAPKPVPKPAPKTLKAVKKTDTVAVAKPEAKSLKAVAKPKEKLVRDSFTMPQADFALIASLKNRALLLKRPAKKSELLRAGLHALQALTSAQLLVALNALVPLKAGRPKRDES